MEGLGTRLAKVLSWKRKVHRLVYLTKCMDLVFGVGLLFIVVFEFFQKFVFRNFSKFLQLLCRPTCLEKACGLLFLSSSLWGFDFAAKIASFTPQFSPKKIRHTIRVCIIKFLQLELFQQKREGAYF